MAYCDGTDVRTVYDAERVAEALDADGDGLPDAALLNRHIRWAGGRVFAHLSHRFPSYRPSTLLPATTTDHINELTAILAAYSALGRNGRLIQRRYDQAIEDLVEIREGRNSLDGVGASNVADSLRKDKLRTFREKDAIVADHGEPSPGEVDGSINNEGFTNFPPT